MSEQTRLGELASECHGRDAIHVAVAPVIAAGRLSPGQHVGFIGERVGKTRNPIGIVDPFLKGPVREGDRFFLVLYPGTITSLRHEWEHASFPKLTAVTSSGVPASGSEAWLRMLADRVGVSYGRLLDGASEWVRTHDGKWGGEYLTGGDEMEGEETPKEFWDHYENVTGERVPQEKRGSFFSCSCS